MICESCGYAKNEPSDLACSLCGRVLSGRLPKGGLSTRAPEEPKRWESGRISRPTGKLTQRLGQPKLDPKAAGLQRLQEAQTRVTRKLEKLADLQSENVPILQAQIQAEQEERDLAEELVKAGETLNTNTEELRLAENALRSSRKKLANLKFELQQRVAERLRTASEREDIAGELESLRRIDRELSGAGEPADGEKKGSRDTAATEIEGLQAVCMRLSERVTVLNLQLNDRDSYLHWLLEQQDPERGKVRADEVTALLKAIADAKNEDCVRWLEGEWKRLVRSLAGSSQP